MVMLWALISCVEIRAQEIQKVSNDSIALQEVVCEGGTSSQQGRWQVDIPKRYSEAAFFFWFFAFRKVGFASYQG